ncbi:hypothetical protein LIER_43753 [Lithospermum erythrorhizon]|uniref:DUF4283 domain-containing protein n=1 Tax=Lithospermum erythrorhizon TaxID=34254 RepID=A0AAV3QRD8_LITER
MAVGEPSKPPHPHEDSDYRTLPHHEGSNISFSNQPPLFSEVVKNHFECNQIEPNMQNLISTPLKPLSIYQGKPCVRFKMEEKATLLNNLKFVLVCKFSHGRPQFSTIKQFFAGLKLQGFTMRVFKWDRNFSPYRESTIAPVWIRIEKLPLYLFYTLSLLSIC